MSKSSKSGSSNSVAVLSHAEEYAVIKHDLVRVLILNALYLIALLAVYYTNQRSGYLDRILGHWLHF